MGKVIAGLVLVGGFVVIRSLMSPAISMPILITGLIIMLIALVLFIKEVLKIG